ncbi:MAG: 5'/3'-nucleotidase SurE [Aestuariivirga sp.]|uniref:5'/3'-nucleotidase SurE n=1 Tax=Aestuariivirga sp. TaxID=2650926 RepID=UPI0038CFE9AD
MRILVTNDDGIHAPGLETLERIARSLSEDVWVVAPAEENSGAGHSLSLAEPIRFRKIEARRFEVAGTPTDCVVMAARKILPGDPDLVLSGVNRGQNIADDVTYSGTIAAAMEGTQLGFKSIALSQVTGIHGNGMSFEVAEKHGSQLVARLIAMNFGPGILMNVNFPDCRPDEVQGIEVTRQGKRDVNLLHIDERTDMRGNNYYWLGFKRERGNPPAGTDLWAVFNRRISVTPLHMNLTQLEAMDAVRAVLDQP